MAGGQQIDLDSTGAALTLQELEFMHVHKTGALIRAAVLLGFWCGEKAREDERKQLDRYAKAVGLAFQVVDDLLDAEASTATLGKTAGKDSKQGKPTYVSVAGLPEARRMAEELREQARSAIAGFGARGRRLAELADFIVLRKF
jgi:farnesyl diphosphate synthase